MPVMSGANGKMKFFRFGCDKSGKKGDIQVEDEIQTSRVKLKPQSKALTLP
jgi:hypothetical protein